MAKKVILCVDDEVVIVQTLRILLKSLLGDSYFYETSTSGEESLKLLEEIYQEGNEISLIISDWLMPGMKGDEFLSLVKKKYPKIPSIILTGQIDPSSETRVKEEAGCYKVLYKPWHTNQLFETIKECILK